MSRRNPDPDSNCSRFQRFARAASKAAGHPLSFILAALIIVGWGLTGPMFRFSDTWQLVINTGTTIVTFLMVFLLQNTQNRDSEAMHLKLDELIRATKAASNSLVNIEDLSQDELDQVKSRYAKIAGKGRPPESAKSSAAPPQPKHAAKT